MKNENRTMDNGQSEATGCPLSVSDFSCSRPIRIAVDVRVLQGEDARRGIGNYTRGLTETLLAMREKLALEISLLISKKRPDPDMTTDGARQICAVDLPAAPGPMERVFGHLPGALGRGWRMPRDAQAILRAARSADILHFSSPLHGPYNWEPARDLFCTATVYDLIPALHPSLFLERWPEAARRRYLTRLGRLPFLDRLLAISESARQDLISFARVPPERVSVAYPAARGPAAPSDGQEKRENFLLAFVSRNPAKNTDILLRAYALLPAETRRAHRLRLVGPHDADTRNWLMQRTETLGLRETMDFYGPEPDDALDQLYQSAALFILPSLAEGFGLPLLEAITHAAPAAVSGIPVFREILGEGGCYFDPSDPESIAETLRTALARPDLRQEMSRKGSERATKFQWESTARIAAGVFHALVSAPDRS